MRRREVKLLVGLFLLAMIGVACTEKKTETKKNDVKMVSGMFVGELPCADCPGILTHVTFDKDGKVAITSLYEDRGNYSETEWGTWKFDDGLIRVALPSDSAFYLVKSDSLIAQVDKQGKEVNSALRKNYLLAKQKEMDAKAFEGEYWLGGESGKGYKQKLEIKKKGDWEAEVIISFTGATKGCTFTGRGKVINDQIDIPLHESDAQFNSVMIVRFVKDDVIGISTAREADLKNLAYFCGGGASLAGEYERATEKK